MSYLVDTNVLCEPQQKRPDAKVVEWLENNQATLYTSVLVMGEIRYGIELLPQNSAKHSQLMNWYARLRTIMTGHILSINARVADEWARLQAEARAKNLTFPTVDSLLAATARRYQLTIVTDNEADFRTAGVQVFNPFAD